MNAEQYENTLLNNNNKMIVGVVGSRRRNSDKDYEIIFSYGYALIRKARKANIELQFVSGGCPTGADFFIKRFCQHNDIVLVEHLPKKVEKYSPYFERVQAFHARNKLIAEDANFILAMVAPDRTGGTENTIFHAVNLGKKVVLI
jgi:hypothetical protein